MIQLAEATTYGIRLGIPVYLEGQTLIIHE